jgi:hypothetical protein
VVDPEDTAVVDATVVGTTVVGTTVVGTTVVGKEPAEVEVVELSLSHAPTRPTAVKKTPTHRTRLTVAKG